MGKIALVKAEELPPSAEWGRHVAIVGGCNDCHRAGYAESNGKLDPSVAFRKGIVPDSLSIEIALPSFEWSLMPEPNRRLSGETGSNPGETDARSTCDGRDVDRLSRR